MLAFTVGDVLVLQLVFGFLVLLLPLVIVLLVVVVVIVLLLWLVLLSLLCQWYLCLWIMLFLSLVMGWLGKSTPHNFVISFFFL